MTALPLIHLYQYSYFINIIEEKMLKNSLKILLFILMTIFVLFHLAHISKAQQTSINNNSPTIIKVAMLIAENTTDYGLTRANSILRNSGGAITLALDRLVRENVLPDNLNFSFEWKYDNCRRYQALGLTYQEIHQDQADVFFASPCIDVPPTVGFMATYNNLPMLVWGQSMVSTLSNSDVYPTLLSVVPNYRNMARVLCDIMDYFDWTQFAMVIQSDLTGTSGGCMELSKDIDAKTNGAEQQCKMSYKSRIFNMNITDSNVIIQQLKNRARIIVLCFDDVRQQRAFALNLFDADMNTRDYVYIFLDFDMTLALDLTKPPFWMQKRRSDLTAIQSDGRDADAEVIGRLGFFLHLDISSNISDMSGFYDRVMAKMREWPFFCSDCGSRAGENASIYSPLLYDAFYAYGLALATTFNKTGGQIRSDFYRNGTLIALNGKRTFQGMTGMVSIGSDGKRQSFYAFSRRMSAEKNNAMEILLSLGVTSTKTNITTRNVSIWSHRGGIIPVAVPKCGFDGNGCPISAFELYKGYFIAAISLFAIVIAFSITLITYIIHIRIRDRKRQDLLWQVQFNMLTRIKKKHRTEHSERSIQSGPSTSSSKFTVESQLNSKNFGLYTFRQEECIGFRHCPSGKFELCEQGMAELRAMRILDHENLNRFHGLSLDGPEVLSIWKFCPRGSIRDVLNNNTLTKDTVFIQSIVWELCEGLHFLHNSQLQCHGNLRSTYCLIDERWQVKIAYFGLRSLRKFKELKTKDLVWKAPEQLRLADAKGNEAMLEEGGTKQADIYTMALIFTEVVNMRPCWDEEGVENVDESEGLAEIETTNRRNIAHAHQGRGGARGTRRLRNAEEIVYLVKKGGIMPLRPIIKPAMDDLNPALLHLIRDCWADNPAERPNIGQVRSILRSTREAANANLMDHVFNMLEQYATRLEQEVDERTRELVEEKKKSDILLYRMLPKQVADRLKLGQSVEPESFECVTVFFSDVVGFTAISQRLKPLQLVNLMNELYTAFDGIIAEHDVYKVETIGDGYLCVSGLPRRNGNQHGKQCADMSLQFMRILGTFSIPTLPDERIRLRIGLHSGPCVAGVVGLAMPRYCLFGDTVNTASRMESSSSPNKIHISKETQQFLAIHFDGYLMEPRGDVIIKGKGVMQTFWLLDYLPGTSAQQSSSNLIDGPNGHKNAGLRRRNSFRQQEFNNGVEMYRNYREKIDTNDEMMEEFEDGKEEEEKEEKNL